MGIYARNGKYFIDYRFQGRRIRECVGPNKKMAEQALAIKQAEIAQGRFQIKAQHHLSFRDFAATYLDFARTEKRSWERDKSILTNLLPFFGHRNLGDITSFLIENYKQQRVAKVKPATVNREIALLKHMFNMAIRWGKADANPMKDVRLFREDNIQERVLSQDEITRILDSCSDYYRPVVLTALHTGMRKNEIHTLKWSQVDLEQRVITVLFSKNGRIRKIPINGTLLALFQQMKTRASSEYVFIYPNSKGPVPDSRTAWLNALKKSGIPHCRFHDLRHTFATHLVAAGVDLVTVKELMGHQNILMTTRYAHAAPENKRNAVALLDNRMAQLDGHQMDTKPKLIEYTTSALEPQLVETKEHTEKWRGGREAEGGGLLNRYTVLKPYLGFESPPLRQIKAT
jgi:integrase